MTRQKEIQQEMRNAGPAELKASLRILDHWGFARREKAKVLAVKPSTITGYQAGRIPKTIYSLDRRERISYIMGIAKALEILVGNQTQIAQWINQPTFAPPFGGQPPKKRILAGLVADLYVTRQYLDSQLNNNVS